MIKNVYTIELYKRIGSEKLTTKFLHKNYKKLLPQNYETFNCQMRDWQTKEYIKKKIATKTR